MAKRSSQKKRRIRRAGGRPRIEHVTRTRSGRISRARTAQDARSDFERKETERQAMEVAVKARARHTGLSEDQAKEQFAGDVLGLIHYDGQIERYHREAGNRFAQDMARYYGLTGIPFPSAKAHSLFDVRGYHGDESRARSEAARRASNRMMELDGLLSSCQDGRIVKTKVFEVCVLDIGQAREWNSYTIGLMKRGLDRLVEFYGIPRVDGKK